VSDHPLETQPLLLLTSKPCASFLGDEATNHHQPESSKKKKASRLSTTNTSQKYNAIHGPKADSRDLYYLGRCAGVVCATYVDSQPHEHYPDYDFFCDQHSPRVQVSDDYDQ
jgi:hypothetical protein